MVKINKKIKNSKTSKAIKKADPVKAGSAKTNANMQMWGIYPVASDTINKQAITDAATTQSNNCTPIIDATLNQTHLAFLEDLLHICKKHKVDFYSNGLVKFREDFIGGVGSYGPTSALTIVDLTSVDLPITNDAIIVTIAGIRTGLNFK